MGVRGTIRISNLNRANIRSGHGTNAIHGNAVIDHTSVVPAIVALNDRRVIVDLSNVVAAHAIASGMAIIEIPDWNKRVMP